MAKPKAKRKPKKKSRGNKLNRIIGILVLLLIAVLIGIYFLYASWKNGAKENLLKDSKVVETSLGPVHFTESGEGEVLLVVHGLYTGWDFIAAYQSFTSSGFRVICPSRPGYPGTPLSSGPSFQDQANLLKKFLDALDINQKIYIATTTTGAPVAILFAKKYPGLCKGIIIQDGNLRSNDASLLPERSNGLPFYFTGTADFDGWLNIMAAKYRSAALATRLLNANTFLEESRSAKIAEHIMNNEEEKDKIINWIRMITPPSLRISGTENDLRNLRNMENSIFAGMKVPVLFMHSRINKWISPGLSDWIAEQYPATMVYTYEGLGPFYWIGNDWPAIQQKMLDFMKTKTWPKVIPGNTPLGKTWVSRADGAMLSIAEDGSFSLDFPSVEETEPWKGKITFDGDRMIIRLENHKDLCDPYEGVYVFKFQEGELIISAEKDRCKIRKERFSDSWFLL